MSDKWSSKAIYVDEVFWANFYLFFNLATIQYSLSLSLLSFFFSLRKKEKKVLRNSERDVRETGGVGSKESFEDIDQVLKVEKGKGFWSSEEEEEEGRRTRTRTSIEALI